MCTDLIITRLKAHYQYLAPRIHNKKKQHEFIESMTAILNNVQSFEDNSFRGIKDDKHGGTKLAVDCAMEIFAYDEQRFNVGRSGDFYLEKI